MNTKTILGVLLTLVFGLVPQTSANEAANQHSFYFR